MTADIERSVGCSACYADGQYDAQPALTGWAVVILALSSTKSKEKIYSLLTSLNPLS